MSFKLIQILPNCFYFRQSCLKVESCIISDIFSFYYKFTSKIHISINLDGLVVCCSSSMTMNQISSPGGYIQTLPTQCRGMLSDVWNRQQIFSHTNHSCSYCGRTFDRKHNLKQHILSVHERVRYPCRYCDKSYTGPSNLYKHVKKNKQLHRKRSRLNPS